MSATKWELTVAQGLECADFSSADSCSVRVLSVLEAISHYREQPGSLVFNLVFKGIMSRPPKSVTVRQLRLLVLLIRESRAWSIDVPSQNVTHQPDTPATGPSAGHPAWSGFSNLTHLPTRQQRGLGPRHSGHRSGARRRLSMQQHAKLPCRGNIASSSVPTASHGLRRPGAPWTDRTGKRPSASPPR